jgi:hypothetical protein
LGDDFCWQVEVIGQEYEDLAVLRISESDPAKAIRVMSSALRITKPHDVIAADASGPIHCTRLQAVELDPGFRACDEECSGHTKR